MNRSVCAVIVTYNRKTYLASLLESLLKQTYPLSAILIVDNHSSDGTDTMLTELGIVDSVEEDTIKEKNTTSIRWLYYRSSENSGGSGGFNNGLRLATEMEYDYIWAMDDDVCPADNCLENLVKHMSMDSQICVPNRNCLKFTDNAVTAFNLSSPFGAMVASSIPGNEIEQETVSVVGMAFEGPLIDACLVKKIGLPNKDLFIFFDDTDYAMRASKETNILYCRNAILNKQIIPTVSGFTMMNWRDYYMFRNMIWFYRKYATNVLTRKLKPIFIIARPIVGAIVKRKWANLKVLYKAYADGIGNKLGKTVEPGTPGSAF